MLGFEPFEMLSPRLGEVLRSLFAVDSSTLSPRDLAAVVLGDGADESGDAARVLELRSAAPPGRNGTPGPVRIADDDGVPFAFRGRTMPDVEHGVEPLELRVGERVLATGSRGPIWVRSEARGRRIDRCAVSPPRLDGERMRDAFRPGRFMSLLPLLDFAAQGQERRPLPATIIIDDPNLHRPRYGFLDFAAIRAAARTTPLHISMATIPLDAWYSNRRAVALFRGDESPLSLCIHGNNHAVRELARPMSSGQALGELAQALRRIERFESSTGLQVSRVMVAPHGACAPETLRRLTQVGIDAISIGHPRPWGLSDGDNRDVMLGARPIELFEGAPMVLRRHLSELDDLPFAAFLGQPLVAYGHHWDWPEGAAGLAATASSIESFGEVTWSRLDASAAFGVEAVRTGETVCISLRSRRTAFLVPPGVGYLTVGEAGMDERDTALVDGRPIVFEEALAVVPGDLVELRLRGSDEIVPDLPPSPKIALTAVVRRVLTESRDRLYPAATRLGISRAARS